jgi:enamine deaminase RidA (YjgF/YER057c/UK114 family)
MAYAHVHLENPKADLPGFVETWNDLYAGKPPLTVISPSNGLGSLGATIEITPFAIKPKGRTKLSDISVKGLASFCEAGPLARRVGDLVFTSTLAAVDDRGLVADAKSRERGPNFFDQTEMEMTIVLDRLEKICTAAGGSLADVVKLRVYLTTMQHLPAAYRPLHDRLKGRAAISPIAIEGVSDLLPGCTLCVDAVAYIPAK